MYARILATIAAMTLLSSAVSLAQQKGQWVPGQYGLNGDVIPDPGFTYENLALNYCASSLNNSSGNGGAGFSNTFVAPFNMGWHFSHLNLCTGYPFTAPTGRPLTNEYVVEADPEGSNTALFRAINGQPSAADSASADPPQPDTTGPDNAWHFAVTPYLWFPGVHGTATGPAGRGLSFRASPGDLLSHFRFGLMGAAEATHKRLVVTGDVLWVRLRDDKSVPFPVLGASSATMKASEFFLTPKIGLAVVDQEQIKIIALTGMRYWHLGENLNFSPSLLGLNFNGSQNFVDPLVGGRIEAFLSPRVVVNILGDVGGWGTGSQLEYQWAGTLGYRVNARWALHAGYRYLYVDKNADRGVVFKATTAGVVLGITLDLK